MYNSFFSLRESPFNVNVDPRFFCPTRQTEETLQRLAYGIQNRKGLILLTGEVGTGKTMMINQLLDWLRQLRTPTAFVFNSNLGEGDLLNLMACDFGISAEANDRSNLTIRLNRWLHESYRAGVSPVLIVDEAQGLSFERLEEIRLLLNIETPSEKMLQIVFAGQPELEERLNQPEGRQLRQRIAVRCKINPLTVEQTHGYIEQRLRIAGASEPIFQPQAMDAVYFYARGIPRVINLICEHSLIYAYVDQLRPVPARTIEEVAAEFQLLEVQPSDAVLSPSPASVRPPSMQSAFRWMRPDPVASHEPAEAQRAHAAVAGVSSRLPTLGPNNQSPAAFSDPQALSVTPTMPEASASISVPFSPAALSASAEQLGHWPLVLPAPIFTPAAEDVSAVAVTLREASVKSCVPSASARAKDLAADKSAVRSHELRGIENAVRRRRWIPVPPKRQTLRRWWSVCRDEWFSMLRSPALRRISSSLSKWLAAPTRRVHQRTATRRWKNVDHGRGWVTLLLHRVWFTWEDKFLANIVEMARQRRTALFRWLQQPLSSAHRR
jgi:type II secretory pathway predicted ATPase ExeA